jgi:hemolysin activation/secretion protein
VIPSAPGDLLNLRDIEQGLENLRGLPTADADIKIVPGERPGESDLVIAHHQAFPLRGTLTADDSGTKATGKYQGGVTIAFDNAAHLSDLLYLTLNHDISGKGGRGTDGGIFHYSVPFGYWNASMTLDSGSNHQTVVGASQNYTYSGRTANAELKLGRLVYRDGNNKTSLSASAFRRTASNFIDDTEVEVQRRRTAGWQASINHRYTQGGDMVDATLGYKRGTGAFNALAAPEELFDEGTSRFQIATLDMTYATPFTVTEMAWRYQINLRGQKAKTRLAAPERFSIGGRQTVRL